MLTRRRAKGNSINVWTNYCFYASFVNLNVGGIRWGYHYAIVNMNKSWTRRLLISGDGSYLRRQSHANHPHNVSRRWQLLSHSTTAPSLQESLKFNQMETKRKMMKRKTFFFCHRMFNDPKRERLTIFFSFRFFNFARLSLRFGISG